MFVVAGWRNCRNEAEGARAGAAAAERALGAERAAAAAARARQDLALARVGLPDIIWGVA